MLASPRQMALKLAAQLKLPPQVFTCCSADRPAAFLGKPLALVVALPRSGGVQGQLSGNLAGKCLPPPPEDGNEHFQRGWQPFLPAK